MYIILRTYNLNSTAYYIMCETQCNSMTPVYLQPFQGIRNRLYLPIDFPKYTSKYYYKSTLRETDGDSSRDGALLHSRQHDSYLLPRDQSPVLVQLVGRCDDSNIITQRIETCSNFSMCPFGSNDRTAHAVVSSDSKYLLQPTSSSISAPNWRPVSPTLSRVKQSSPRKSPSGQIAITLFLRY